MQRLFAFAMILWFIAIGAVHAQTSLLSAPAPDNAVPTAAATPAPGAPPTRAPQPVSGGTSLNGNGCSPSGTSTGGAAAGSACASDPLNVPTSNASASVSPGSVGASSAGSAVGARPPSSVDPEIPVQLPGERPNTSTQAPNTTASAPTESVPAAASAPCSVTMQSAGGSSGVAGVLGGVSSGGCEQRIPTSIWRHPSACMTADSGSPADVARRRPRVPHLLPREGPPAHAGAKRSSRYFRGPSGFVSNLTPCEPTFPSRKDILPAFPLRSKTLYCAT